MRKLFVAGMIGLVLLELANVYFIMPMPGSQRVRSVDAAYAIYRWRWTLRAIFALAIVAGALPAWRIGGRRRWLVPGALVAAAAIAYALNFRLAADQMFRQPTALHLVPASKNKVAGDRLVVGVALGGDARAYPLQFIGYHHQVRDTDSLVPVNVSQEFWHSWREFQPATERY